MKFELVKYDGGDYVFEKPYFYIQNSFWWPDGDGFEVFLGKRDNKWYVTDNGCTIMHMAILENGIDDNEQFIEDVKYIADYQHIKYEDGLLEIEIEGHELHLNPPGLTPFDAEKIMCMFIAILRISYLLNKEHGRGWID